MLNLKLNEDLLLFTILLMLILLILVGKIINFSYGTKHSIHTNHPKLRISRHLPIQMIRAQSTMLARVRATLINVNLAALAPIARLAVAQELVQPILTSASVQTGGGGTLVYVTEAARVVVTPRTLALEPGTIEYNFNLKLRETSLYLHFLHNIILTTLKDNANNK